MEIVSDVKASKKFTRNLEELNFDARKYLNK